MIRKRGLGLVAFILPLALVTCGGSGSDELKEVIDSLQEDDLTTMTLSLDKLGREFAHLEIDPDSSGFSDNSDAAQDTIDPDDTPGDLARLGRVGGYGLTYIDPDLIALEVGEGVISLTMELDLFQDGKGAARFLAKQRDDFQRMEGTLLDNGVRLKQTKVFSVEGMGDEAIGLRIRASYEGTQFYQTIVAFRTERLVGAVVLFRADAADVASQVQRIAKALAARIEEVSLGSTFVKEQKRPTSDQINPKSSDINPKSSGGKVDSSLTGDWRVYSGRLFYDAGGSGASDASASTTRRLNLSNNGTWKFASSSGSWYVTSIKPSDWDRWDIAPYGPKRKVVLEDWNDDVADGPIEEYDDGVDFFWVIYRVEAPDPGTVQMKFGHP